MSVKIPVRVYAHKMGKRTWGHWLTVSSRIHLLPSAHPSQFMGRTGNGWLVLSLQVPKERLSILYLNRVALMGTEWLDGYRLSVKKDGGLRAYLPEEWDLLDVPENGVVLGEVVAQKVGTETAYALVLPIGVRMRQPSGHRPTAGGSQPAGLPAAESTAAEPASVGPARSDSQPLQASGDTPGSVAPE